MAHTRRAAPRADPRATAPRTRSSGSSSRTSRAVGSAASPGSSRTAARRRSATPARTSFRRARVAASSRTSTVRARARMLIGEQAAVERPLGGRAAQAARAARGPAGPAGLRDLGRAPEPGETRAAPGAARRPRPARARLRAGARGRARDRPARAGRRRLPLADAHADRGGPLVALGRGRRHPLQGRGVGVDAGGRAAAAGLDRPRGARRGQRQPRPARPDPPAARAGAARLPLRPRRQPGRDPALRRASACEHVLDYRSVLL